MIASLQNQAVFTLAAIRSAFGHVEYRWLLMIQLLGGVVLLSGLFGGSVVGVENSLPQSITYALSGWVPALTARVLVAGLSGLGSMSTVALLPRFKQRRGRAVLSCAVLAAVLAACASALLSVLTPVAAGACALAAFTCGVGSHLGQGIQRAASVVAFLVLHVALTRGGLDALALPDGRPLVGAILCGGFLVYRLRSAWPERHLDTGSGQGHGAISMGFPAPRTLGQNNVSTAARLREADQFRRAARNDGSPWKLQLTLLFMTMVPGLIIVSMSALGLFEDSTLGVAERLYNDFVTDLGPDGKTPSSWSEASVIALPLLMLSSLFAMSQHSVLGPVLVSRGTLARVALRGYIWNIALATAATILGISALTGLVASLTGFGWPERVPPVFVALTLLIGLIPWIALLTLAVQREALQGVAASASSVSLFSTYKGFFVALMVGMPAYQIGVRFLQTKVLVEPTVLSVLPMTLVSVAVGAALLPAAFRRYYGRVSLER